MAYSSPFIYTRVLGTLGNNAGGVEQWGVGWKIPHAGTGITPSQLLDYLTGISDDVQTFHTGSALAAGNTCFVKQLTAAIIGTDGKYVGGGTQTTQIYNYTTPPAGNGTATLPWSTAICISLRTQFARGYASNGRVYWPMLAQSVTAGTGQIGSANQTAIANGFRTLLDAVNAQAATTFATSNRVSVMSQVGSGTLAPVTSVRVGSKPDRQERRERAVTENYVSASLASTRDLVLDSLAAPILR